MSMHVLGFSGASSIKIGGSADGMMELGNATAAHERKEHQVTGFLFIFTTRE
jgi:hypothetical protein